ncbi:MAG: DUF4280 domain-containing protein [Bacillota bacterium]
MGLAVCNGAICTCTFGLAPCSLVVTSVGNVMGCSLPVATIMDFQVANLSTFGMCTSMSNPAVSAATAAALGVLTPQPCVPVIPSPWQGGSSTVMFAGKPALMNNGQNNCSYGGMIAITSPAQGTVNVN